MMSPTGQQRDCTPVWGLAADYPPGKQIDWHAHDEAQLIFAATGLMRVTVKPGHWVVPPRRAVWIPAGVAHAITCIEAVAVRTIYVDPAAAPWLPRTCGVLPPSPLLGELVMAAMALEGDYPEEGPGARLVAVLLDQLDVVPAMEMHLPIPRERRLRRIVEGLIADPADGRGLAAWAAVAGASERTLARLFAAETGMGFRAWRQQMRLHEALARLA
ncbi:MAG: AraC family transcriptional regulator, partial [Alphaproteobacteria bacterium]